MKSSPYADWLHISVDQINGRHVVQMNPGDHVRGRPGFLHGGAITALLDIAAIAAVQVALGEENPVIAELVNASVDFFRGGKMELSYARGNVLRLGRRIANVEAVAWQEDLARPIAMARMNFRLLDRPR